MNFLKYTKYCVIGLLSIGSLSLTGCQSGNNQTNESIDTELNQEPSLPEAAQQADTVSLEAKDLVYLPPIIHASPNQDIIFAIKNNGEEYHSIVFVFPQDSIKMGDSIPPGSSGNIKIRVPAEPGNYEFYCPMQMHKTNGMKGEIIVDDSNTGK